MTDKLFGAAAGLVVVLTVLLFAQWPLRDIVQAHSRLANDFAQVIFALYMAVAVSAATRAGAHLTAGDTGQHSVPVRGWRAWALFACTAPWAVFLLWSSAPSVASAVLTLERFPETLDPGYFLVKLAVWVLAFLTLADAFMALRREARGR